MKPLVEQVTVTQSTTTPLNLQIKKQNRMQTKPAINPSNNSVRKSTP